MNRVDRVHSVLFSKSKVRIPFKGDCIADAMKFGFSYIESEDHIVEYIACNPRMMKRTFKEIPDDFELLADDPDGGIGRLWTATMLITNKLNDGQIVFSNNTFSAVVDVILSSEEHL